MILLLCCLAAIHVFIFSAAFPFFNNVDEQAHFDLAVKYSQWQVPRKLEPVSAESARYIGTYGTMEYMVNPAKLPDGKFPPPLWMQPLETAAPELVAGESNWRKVINWESGQPPLYYICGGLWWRLGQWLGFDGLRLLYWLRFLNIPLICATVWTGYVAARLIFPENFFARFCVPAFIAFMPQPTFYSLENDTLSPLAFGVAFIGLTKFLCEETPGAVWGMVTGLALAATFLTKMTNLPLLVIGVVVVLLKIFRTRKSTSLRALFPSIATMAISAGLLTGPWMAWCRENFGDFTGSITKTRYLGLACKPFGGWWHHPIFTPHGAWFFLSGNLGTFWQGEFLWHGGRLTWLPADALYTLASLFLLAVAAAGLWQHRTIPAPAQRAALAFALAVCAAGLTFYALLSVIYDFRNCTNPSPALPYFVSGRMLLGALIPFMLLFVCGFDRLLGRFGNRAKFPALASMVSAMLILEITTDWPVFFSQYNWFHL